MELLPKYCFEFIDEELNKKIRPRKEINLNMPVRVSWFLYSFKNENYMARGHSGSYYIEKGSFIGNLKRHAINGLFYNSWYKFKRPEFARLKCRVSLLHDFREIYAKSNEWDIGNKLINIRHTWSVNSKYKHRIYARRMCRF